MCTQLHTLLLYHYESSEGEAILPFRKLGKSLIPKYGGDFEIFNRWNKGYFCQKPTKRSTFKEQNNT